MNSLYHATQTPNTLLIRDNNKTWSAHDFNRLIDALAMHCAHPQISKGVGIYLEKIQPQPLQQLAFERPSGTD